MKKLLLPVIVLSVSISAVSLLAPSGACAAGRPAGGAASKTETYLVIKVTDENKTENKVDFKAIAKSQLKDEQKRANDDYKTKMKEWHDLRKTDPSAPAPKRIKIEKIQSDYETQKVAQDYADKLKKEAADNGDQKPVNKDSKK